MLTKKGCKTTESDVFAAIALKIENKDGRQCQVKWKNLKQEARQKDTKIKSLRNTTGAQCNFVSKIAQQLFFSKR